MKIGRFNGKKCRRKAISTFARANDSNAYVIDSTLVKCGDNQRRTTRRGSCTARYDCGANGEYNVVEANVMVLVPRLQLPPSSKDGSCSCCHAFLVADAVKESTVRHECKHNFFVC